MALRLKQSVYLSSRNTNAAVAGIALLLPPCYHSRSTSTYITTRRSSQWTPLRPTKRLNSSFSAAAADHPLLHEGPQETLQLAAQEHQQSLSSTPTTTYEQFQERRSATHGDTAAKTPPLSLLNMTSIVRSLAVNTISSSPLLLQPSLTIMAFMANSHSMILSPDRNPLLRWFLKRTFYAQYCGGENGPELQKTVQGLKKMGYEGVILVYAKEVEIDHNNEQTGVDVAVEDASMEVTPEALADIETWRKGTLDTVRLAEKGDMVALKFSGAGALVNHRLDHRHPQPAELIAAMTDICELATSRSVKLLVDAEHASMQAGIDDLGIQFSRLYNRSIPGQATVYGTYQAYLKQSPQVLANHLAVAAAEGFTLGVKLVRGAYMSSDPRHLIHDTKADTDQCFDGIMEALMHKQYNHVLTPAAASPSAAFPDVNLVIASHNAASVRKAQEIERAQTLAGAVKADITYAQLMGMADEVSCELLQAGHPEAAPTVAPTDNTATSAVVVKPRAYKYLVWGSTGECMKYLHRRALENRDAVGRTKEARDLLAIELWRRLKTIFAV